MRPLVVVESLFLVAFLALAVYAGLDDPDPLPAVDVAALAIGEGDEQWVGIFLEDQHIGYAVSREIPANHGGVIYQYQSALTIGSMGTSQKIVTAGTALTDKQGRLVSFDFLLSTPDLIVGKGEMRGTTIHLEIVRQGETTVMDLPSEEVPVLSSTFSTVLRGKELKPGLRFSVPQFNPVIQANAPMEVVVEEPEILPNGDNGWWLRTTYAGMSTRRLIDESGRTVKEVAESMGFSTVRMPKEAAIAVSKEDPPDLVALARAPLKGRLNDARKLGFLKLKVSGVSASQLASAPPLQVVEGDFVTVSIPLLAELPDLPIRGQGNIEATPTLPATHEEIRSKAKSLVEGAETRLEAARRIADFVFKYVEKVPTVGVPNGLDVLRSARGDCNEHTALFVSLARAVGIPSRIAAGLVYSDRLGNAFYYHAWPEVQLGGPTDWVPIDPTFGEFPADATHVKVVNGDLERQVEIMGLMGKVRLEVVEAR